MGPEVDDCYVDIPSYSVLRQDHNLGGEGVPLYVKNNLKAEILYSSKTTQQGKPLKIEFSFFAVWEGNSPPTLVVLVYRPPDVPLRSDRHFLRLLRFTFPEYSHKAIMGDWNADMLDLGSSDSRFVWELMT